jgi:hypothetical protein
LVAVKEVLENPLETINGYQSQKQVSFASWPFHQDMLFYSNPSIYSEDFFYDFWFRRIFFAIYLWLVVLIKKLFF